MISLHAFLTLRHTRKTFKSLRNEFRLYEDLLELQTREALQERFRALSESIRQKDIANLPPLLTALNSELTSALPPKKHLWLCENFDIIVSALAVAFCFRAYYYQPFKIPTGSMQPTLYGIHSEPAKQPGLFDQQPLKFLKWCVTGESWKDISVRHGGTVVGFAASTTPGYGAIRLSSGEVYELPDDVLMKLRDEGRLALPLRAHQTLWRGYVRSGDFLFVNRWIWNFRHPTLGETIVFSTEGIQGLPQDQHYIKRLCGTPGTVVEIKPESNALYVNGQPALHPSRLREIAEHARPYPGAQPYLGYQIASPAPGYTLRAKFDLQPGEYIAFGDNSGNSLDSRYWGTIPSRNLVGPASFVHWPFTSPRWGKIQ
ncbi:MAG: signal peptidase I [Kiritimatiellia bacterium]